VPAIGRESHVARAGTGVARPGDRFGGVRLRGGGVDGEGQDLVDAEVRDQQVLASKINAMGVRAVLAVRARAFAVDLDREAGSGG